MSSPDNPGGPPGYTLNWERKGDRDAVPGGAPEGWKVEYDPQQKNKNPAVPAAPLEPQVRAASAPNEPVRSGSHSVRFQLYKGDKRVSCGVRSELSVREYEPPGAERWYGFSVYLPHSWTPDPAPETVVQWHQDEHAPDGSPPLSIGTQRASNDKGFSHWYVSQRDWTKNDTVPFDAGRCELGQWTDWVVHVVWSPSENDGRLEVWKNGSQVSPLVEGSTRRTTFSAETRHYMKIGIYKWLWNVEAKGDVFGDPCGSKNPNTSNQLRRVIYHDELRVMDGDGSREAVSPRGPKPRPTPR